MHAPALYLLGRRLMQIAESALPSPPGGLRASVRLVLMDIGEHGESTIGEITERTGFPQSHVSASVARLRELGAVQTTADPVDGRRTLVAVTPQVAKRGARASLPADQALAAAVDGADTTQLEAALDLLARHLVPNVPRTVKGAR